MVQPSHGAFVLLLAAAATVAVVHSVLPDHWVPLALVGRTQRWSTGRVARVSGLAAAGHVVASLALAAIVALVGLRYQAQMESQQGKIVGSVLVITGIGLLVWGLTGHGHSHDHGDGSEREKSHDHGPSGHTDHDPHWHTEHLHQHSTGARAADHQHRHEHQGRAHSHPHSHDEFIRLRQEEIVERTGRPHLLGRLSAMVVPFGVAASPDLTILPIALAASAYGRAAVVSVLAVFSVLTIATFVGLTVVATAAGYSIRGRWFEENANTVTSLVLVGVGVVAFFGF